MECHRRFLYQKKIFKFILNTIPRPLLIRLSIVVRPIIAFLLLLESLSVIIQVLSKKIRKKKVFLSAPIHHHFEAKGWPETKVVMRFWIISAVTAVLGLIIAIIDMNL